MGVNAARRDLGPLLAITAVMGLSLGVGAPDDGAGRSAEMAGDDPMVSCADCHPTERGFSHPVGIVPTMKIPKHLPLSRGRLSCRTCHEDPGAQGHVGERSDNRDMLRSPSDPEGFCTQCHRAAASLRSRAHGTSLTRAHLRWPRGSATRRDPPDPTRSCQACHDGSIAMEAEKVAGAGGGHPVGMAYAATRSPLAQEAALPAEITILDGRVGCTSCHSPYSSLDAQLVMPNRDSRLCLSCHRL